MKIRMLALLLSVLAGTACSSFEVSSGHLRNTVPRFTTYSTDDPEKMAGCIWDKWSATGSIPLTTTRTNTGYALVTTQALAADDKKNILLYVAIDTSREGSSVRFYTNRADELSDRSMIGIIQRCD